MKLLRLSTYCFPEEVSSTHLSQDINDAMVAEGWFLENYVPVPSRGISNAVRQEYKKKKYEERMNGHFIIHRFNMIKEGKNPVQRAIKYTATQIVQYLKAAKLDDIDVLYSGSTPPTQGILFEKVKKKLSKKYGRNVPFVYNLQDVFPDSLLTLPFIKRNGLIWKIGDKIAKRTYDCADRIIVISEDIKKNIVNKGVPEQKIRVIYNWIDTECVKPVPTSENNLIKELNLDEKVFRVVYAGNLGMAQGIGTLIDAAKILSDKPDIQFVIFGKGSAEKQLRKQAENMDNIQFFPLQPQERVSEVYSLGDCCAILCKKGVGATGVPSKTWSIMATGRPIVLSFDESELKNIVEESGAGLCSPAEDAERLAENILKLFERHDLRKAMGEQARKYAVEHASKENAVQAYIDVIKDVISLK